MVIVGCREEMHFILVSVFCANNVINQVTRCRMPFILWGPLNMNLIRYFVGFK